jgi:hypothetical protein
LCEIASDLATKKNPLRIVSGGQLPSVVAWAKPDVWINEPQMLHMRPKKTKRHLPVTPAARVVKSGFG